MSPQPTVYVVDDNAEVRESIALVIKSMGLNGQGYGSAEEFLEHYRDELGPPRCLLLDVNLPGLDGLGLQKKLVAGRIKIPVIMITGVGNVSMAVQAIKVGAVDFIEKPFSLETLMLVVQKALDRDTRQRADQAHGAEVAHRLAILSHREREVLDLLVAGLTSKHIATKLKISEKTVAKHRVAVFRKMQVDGIAELVALLMS
jgi:FixJ family two-component response regulator